MVVLPPPVHLLRLQVWAQRPLTEELMQYAASDVRHMHQLLDALNLKLPASIIDKVGAYGSASGGLHAPVIIRACCSLHGFTSSGPAQDA